MQLIEEYLQRHSIKKKIPKHIETYGVFFLKSAHDKWHVVKIMFDMKPRPGRYQISSLIPRMNPLHYMDDYNFFECTNQMGCHYIDWSEYWDYFYRWTKKIAENKDLTPIGDDKDLVLTIWEIFVFQNAKTFIDSAYNEHFCDSLDVTRPLHSRFKSYHNYLMSMNTPINHGFLSTITSWIQLIRKKYCPWIYDLIKDAEPSKIK